ncbi:hypothetical protein [Mycolicibacterium lacusdiani]|uniref:hypothetical protein n=1 Tax=Mycolicibacterium lacusdiani TaxID=2895283 RepID=UPI001F3BF78B|nr:hypothetical protein [Mycolicibacterium lacusdiani]
MSKSTSGPAAQSSSVRISYSYLGYLFLLLGFLSLGVFVAALAYQTAFVVVAGAALVGSLAASAGFFRIGSLAPAPARGDRVDRYRARYRPTA